MNYHIVAVFGILFGLHIVFCDPKSDAERCSQLGEKAADIEEGINMTYRFLRPPEDYKELAEACKNAIKCAENIDKNFRDQFKEKYGLCDVYIFYNKEFADCANKLIAKKDDKIHCLDILFNDYDEPDVNECEQWDSLQPCIKTQIKDVCGEEPDDWEEQAAIYRRVMCENNNKDD